MCAIFGSSFVYILDNRLISLNSEYKLDLYFVPPSGLCLRRAFYNILKRNVRRYPFMDIVKKKRWVEGHFLVKFIRKRLINHKTKFFR